VEKDSSANGGITIVAQTDGSSSLLVALRPVDTENVAAGNYYHEAEIVDGSSNIFTVAVGKFRLQPAVLPPRST
jgi:hypothetical protein